MPFQGPPPPEQKKPAITQESKGDNSPNVATGDHSTVIINSAPKGNPRFREKIERVYFHFGNNTVGLPVATLRTSHFDLFRAFGGSLLAGKSKVGMYMEGDTIFVDVSITSPSNQLPSVEIKHNEFSQPQRGWDRNFDESALEFVDPQGRALFQLIYQDSTNVALYGVFSPSPGFVLAMTKEGTTINPLGSFNLPPPLFKYPSREHPGERVQKLP
jgi:hypothetical protein